MTCKGTPGYMAPEMININGFNFVTNQKSHRLFSSNGYSGVQTDVFALGVILFGMFLGRPPFKMADINDPFYRMIFCQQIKEFWEPWDSFAAQSNFEIPDDFKDLFIAMVTFNPLMRLSINEVLSSKWMQRVTPSGKQVGEYMEAIKVKIEEFEAEQRTLIEKLMKSKLSANKKLTEEVKEEISVDENLNDSYLSACSQMKDDDDLIMKDLEEIEKELDDLNPDGAADVCINLGDEYEFDIGSDHFKQDEAGIELKSTWHDDDIILM